MRAGALAQVRAGRSDEVLRMCLGLCGAALAVVLSWLGWVLVVGDRVVPGWVVGAALLVVALVLLWFPRSARVPAADEASGARRAIPCWIRAVGTGLAVVGLGLAAAGDLFFGAQYQVLASGNADGCRVVTREASFLMAGSGDIYVVRNLGVGRRTGTWVADEGYRPIREGSYDLALAPDGGTLTVRGTTNDPVMPSTHPIDCG
jgi:hypothetical protein